MHKGFFQRAALFLGIFLFTVVGAFASEEGLVDFAQIDVYGGASAVPNGESEAFVGFNLSFPVEGGLIEGTGFEYAFDNYYSSVALDLSLQFVLGTDHGYWPFIVLLSLDKYTTLIAKGECEGLWYGVMELGLKSKYGFFSPYNSSYAIGKSSSLYPDYFQETAYLGFRLNNVYNSFIAPIQHITLWIDALYSYSARFVSLDSPTSDFGARIGGQVFGVSVEYQIWASGAMRLGFSCILSLGFVNNPEGSDTEIDSVDDSTY